MVGSMLTMRVVTSTIIKKSKRYRLPLKVARPGDIIISPLGSTVLSDLRTMSSILCNDHISLSATTQLARDWVD